MKPGSLVRCKFQPRSAAIQNGLAVPMMYHIKGELGIYAEHRDESSGKVIFPQFGYEHVLAHSALELIN